MPGGNILFRNILSIIKFIHILEHRLLITDSHGIL